MVKSTSKTKPYIFPEMLTDKNYKKIVVKHFNKYTLYY